MSFLQYCLLIFSIVLISPISSATPKVEDFVTVLNWNEEENSAGLTGAGFRTPSEELKAQMASFDQTVENAISQGDKAAIRLLIKTLETVLTPYELERIPRSGRRWYSQESKGQIYVPMNWAVNSYLKKHPAADLYFKNLMYMALAAKNVSELAAITFLMSKPAQIQNIQNPELRENLKSTLMTLTFHPCPIVQANAFIGLAAFVSTNKEVETRLSNSMKMPTFKHGIFGESEMIHYRTALLNQKNNPGFEDKNLREKALAELLKYESVFETRMNEGHRHNYDQLDLLMELQGHSAAAQALIWSAAQRRFSKPVRPSSPEIGSAWEQAWAEFSYLSEQPRITHYLSLGLGTVEYYKNGSIGYKSSQSETSFPSLAVLTQPRRYWIPVSQIDEAGGVGLKETLRKLVQNGYKFMFGRLSAHRAWLKYGLYQMYPPQKYLEDIKAVMQEVHQIEVFKDKNRDDSPTGSMAEDGNDLWKMHPQKILALRALALLGESPRFLEEEIEKILPTYMPIIDSDLDRAAQWDYHAESLSLIVAVLKWLNPNEQAFRNKLNLWLERIKSAELKEYVYTELIPKLVFGVEPSEAGCEVILLPTKRLKP